jgi:hypothetical protein
MQTHLLAMIPILQANEAKGMSLPCSQISTRRYLPSRREALARTCGKEFICYSIPIPIFPHFSAALIPRNHSTATQQSILMFLTPHALQGEKLTMRRAAEPQLDLVVAHFLDRYRRQGFGSNTQTRSCHGYSGCYIIICVGMVNVGACRRRSFSIEH